MLKLAQSEPPLADSGENWDREPLLLVVANGVVNLRTGELRHDKPEDRITMHAKRSLRPQAKCELFLKVLDEIFGRNQELIEYVQRCIGYSLTSLTQEQCIFNAYGSGANGRSTFLEAPLCIRSLRWRAPFTMFEHKNKASIPSDLASTAGKRFITASETEESVRHFWPGITSVLLSFDARNPKDRLLLGRVVIDSSGVIRSGFSKVQGLECCPI